MNGESYRDMHPLERRQRRAHVAQLMPAVAGLLVFFVFPVLWMIRLSFGEGHFSLESYNKIFREPVYFAVLVFTFRIAGLVTLICLLFGYPTAYVLAHASTKTARLLMIVVILPYFTSVIVRSFAWIVLLGRDGIINHALRDLALTDAPVQILYNEPAILIGMSYILLPFMIITLYTVMRGIDQQLMRAAYSAGASRAYTFFRIFLPLTMPGIAGGCMLVFITALGFYIVPALMGGPSNMMISMLVAQQIEIAVNWPFASALATILLLTTLIIFAFCGRLVRGRMLEAPR